MSAMTNKQLVDKYPPKSCPFCGSRKLESGQEPKQNFWFIRCRSCAVQGPPKRDKERAMYLWNFRKLYKDIE